MSIEFIIGEAYNIKDVIELDLVHFYSGRSLWTDGDDIYLFKHMVDSDKRYMLDKIIYKKPDDKVSNCFGPERMGL